MGKGSKREPLLDRVRNARKLKRQRQRLAETLRIATEMLSMSDRKERIVNLHFDSTCPHCFEPQTPDDVLAGAGSSLGDIDTVCSACGETYATTLYGTDADDHIVCRFPWLSPKHTKDQYEHWGGDLKRVVLQDERPEIYYNALRYAWDLGIEV